MEMVQGEKRGMRGRPRIAERKDALVTVLFTESDRIRIAALCKDKGLSVGPWLRSLALAAAKAEAAMENQA